MVENFNFSFVVEWGEMIIYRKKSKFQRNYFTVVELLISIAIFSIMLIALMKFYDIAGKAWRKSNNSAMIEDNARMALELMTREVQSIYYENGTIPFWHKGETTDSDYSNELLAFISTTPLLPNDDCKSRLCEVKYQLYFTSDPADSNAGWLRRSVTGDTSGGSENVKWNFYSNFTVAGSGATNAFTTNSDSSSSYEKLIPYVTALTFSAIKKNGSTIDPTSSVTTEFPYSVELGLSLLDRESWLRWLAIGGNPNLALESSDAQVFRESHQRTFRKMIYIGDRGQYD